MKHPISWPRWSFWVHVGVVMGYCLMALGLGFLRIGWVRWAAGGLLLYLLCWMVNLFLHEDESEGD